MTTLIFASHNKNKAAEINALTEPNIHISTLNEVGISDEIAETAQTLEGNALIKARFARQKTGKACFADDTGLEVEVLGGEPGVYSARYAGEDCNSENNIDKLLSKLSNATNRKARFRTVVAYISADGKEHLFEGIVEGQIAHKRAGSNGFGYDAVFIPTDDNINPNGTLTFAQMDLTVKNQISHRARAISKFVEFIANEH